MIVLICAGIISLIFWGDFFIKNYIERTGVEGETKELLGGRILLRKHHNRGAVLNFADKKRPVVAAISLFVTLLAVVFFILSLGKHGNNLLRMGLSLLLGGAFSNTYDRLKRKYVVDYISFGVKWKKFRGIIFNISDFCIIIGALLSALGAWK